MSEWPAAVLFVSKKGAKILFCMEYRKHSSIAINDKYTLPRMEYFIDTVANAEYVMILDA